MKVTLTYEIQVHYTVDVTNGKVESIVVVKQNGSQLAGYDGYIYASSDTKPFSPHDAKEAVKILRKSVHPKWQIKEQGE
jgi:hypothetical protein